MITDVGCPGFVRCHGFVKDVRMWGVLALLGV